MINFERKKIKDETCEKAKSVEVFGVILGYVLLL